MRWDYADRLHATARQPDLNGELIPQETTYYVYDATGQRARKVTGRAGTAEAAFARGAQGNVTVLQESAVRINSVWAEVEYPALTANPNVTSITAVDPASGNTTLLWRRP